MLQIRPITLVSKPPEKRKKRALPKLVVKETVASKARRYVLCCQMGCGLSTLLFKISSIDRTYANGNFVSLTLT